MIPSPPHHRSCHFEIPPTTKTCSKTQNNTQPHEVLFPSYSPNTQICCFFWGIFSSDLDTCPDSILEGWCSIHGRKRVLVCRRSGALLDHFAFLAAARRGALIDNRERFVRRINIAGASRGFYSARWRPRASHVVAVLLLLLLLVVSTEEELTWEVRSGWT